MSDEQHAGEREPDDLEGTGAENQGGEAGRDEFEDLTVEEQQAEDVRGGRGRSGRGGRGGRGFVEP